jgi:hypothetical protein
LFPLGDGGSGCVVGGLVADVSTHDLEVNVAKREDAVADLPGEVVDVESARDERRRGDLEIAHEVGHGQYRAQANEHVDVILDASDGERHTVTVATEAVEQTMNTPGTKRVEDGSTFLRGPNQMHVEARVRSGHGGVSASPSRWLSPSAPPMHPATPRSGVTT